MKFQIRYRRIRVYVDWKHRGRRCHCCGRAGRLELHHWKYAYTTAEVRANPELALKNTSWFCYPHHRVADALTRFRRASSEVMTFMILAWKGEGTTEAGERRVVKA